MIHPKAEVQTKNIGDGTYVWQFCVILEGARIGRNCNINCNVFIENDVVVGDDVTVKSGVQLWDGLRISDKVFIGPNATFTNDLVPRSKLYKSTLEKTIIEEGVSIGANATVVAGKTIGKYSLIGAGSVVTKNIPPFTVWYGNPAVNKGYITKDGTILSERLQDMFGHTYKLGQDNEPIKI